MDFTEQIYELTNLFSESEKFGLIPQLQRAVVSRPSNIAEGTGRNSMKELKQFLSIALRSVFELETQLLFSERLNYIKKINNETPLVELKSIGKMIHSLRKTLKV